MRGESIQIPLKRAIISPPAKRHLNGVSLAGSWWLNIECWLGGFVIFQGILTSRGSGPPVPPPPPPPLDPRMGFNMIKSLALRLQALWVLDGSVSTANRYSLKNIKDNYRSSVVECLTRDRGAVSWSLTGVAAMCPWARLINPSLVGSTQEDPSLYNWKIVDGM